MGRNELDHVERLLLRDRDRIARSIERLRVQAAEPGWKAGGELSALPIHPADQGTEARNREQALAIAGQESRYFGLIEEALERLYRDPVTFGRCQSCGREIPLDRLEIVPHTRYCVACKAMAVEA